MSTAVAERKEDRSAAVERVLLQGDLKSLSEAERVAYYNRVCESLGLNPLTRPFDYLLLQGKLQLYARRDATEQLRKIHGVSIVRLEREDRDGVYVVTAYARDKTGREDVSTGAVSLEGLKGEARANALMKAETKSKRRVTLSLCGLGFLDETEVETVANARQPASAAAEAEERPRGTISEQQLKILCMLCDKTGYDRDALRREFGLISRTQLSREQASALISRLNEQAQRGDAEAGEGREAVAAEERAAKAGRD
jgi:hypothetical protein